MKSSHNAIISCVLAGLLLSATIVMAEAADCANAARRVVSSTGGELLSAVPSSDGTICTVTVIVMSNDGKPPRKITRQVPAN